MERRRAASSSNVHVLYRYATSTNLKARPPYFSKELALTSFVRALEATDGRARVTFLTDGNLPDQVAALMNRAGRVVSGSYGSNRASYRATLSMAAELVGDSSLTWMAEDDYLYEPDSLSRLLDAADAIPEATWFAMSGPTPPVMLEMRKAQGPVHLDPLPRSGGVVDVAGSPWRRIESTTSSFGGRTDRVLADVGLLRVVPYTGAAWDRTTCLTVQGVTPYPWAHVFSDLVVPSTPREHKIARVAWRVTSRVAINLRSIRLPRNRGVLIAPVTPLIGHMNLPYEERPEHWDSFAAETAAWASAEGIELPRGSEE